ncbi:ABC transporter permease [bacterium]|nr:ABC transporter permease [bacterium]
MRLFFDRILEILKYLRKYKSRTAMTLFGIIWGTQTVILLLAFGVGVRKSMSKNMHGMGEGIAIVWPGATSIPFEGYGRGRPIRITHEDCEYARREVPEILRISPEYHKWDLTVRLKDKIQRPNITGCLPEYGPMRNNWPEAGGRWLNEKDEADQRRVAFLGYDLKNFLFGEGKEAIGKYIYIGEIPFQVIGVLKEKTQPSSYAARDKDRVFIPASTFRSIFGYRYVSTFVYQVANPQMGEPVRDKLYRVMAKKFKFDPKDTETLGIWDTTYSDKFIADFTTGFNIFLGAIGTITLIVGGIGLANIMYVVVQERTREIGIKRSVGARRRSILGEFILEAFIIIGIGAFIGLIQALILIKIISLMPIEDYVGHPELNLNVAFFTILILGSIGFLSGFFPARKASRLNVVDCLRQ